MSNAAVTREETEAIREHLAHTNPRETYDTLFARQLVRPFGDDYLPQLQKALVDLREFCGGDVRCCGLVGAVESAAFSFGDDAHSDGIRFAMMFVKEFRTMSTEVLGIKTTV